MADIIFWVIIIIVLLDFIFEKTLDYMNYKHLKETIPDELKGIYDEEAYKKSQQYEKVNLRFSFYTGSFSLLLILFMLFAGGFALLDDWVRYISDNIYVRTLLFFGILGFAFDLLSLPFQIYATFVIEERFGFNKTTPATFAIDKLKSWLLGIIIGGGLLMFILWAWLASGNWFWLIVVGGLSVFMVFMAMFYTQLIVPLFNKQTPLEEGELRTAIIDFSTKTGFKVDNIFVIDGSKRSNKANAYFSGLGPKKRIVLYDTLINDLEPDEIIGVLAHEIGHYKKNHIKKGLAMSLIQSAMVILLLWLAIDVPALSLALGANEASFYMGIVAFGLLFAPVSFFTGIYSNVISRKYEFQADAFAKKHYSAASLVNALVKLSVKNLSNLTPHPLYVFFHYSHPPIIDRKKALEH